MLEKVEEFLESIKDDIKTPEQQKKASSLSLGSLLDATMGHYYHDIDVLLTKVESLEDALSQMKVLPDLIGSPVYAGFVKGALEYAEGKTFEEVSELRRYIRRGQYIELLCIATCIFLAENVKQLESMTQEWDLLGHPGIYELWKKRKEEIKKQRIKTLFIFY